ncbi:beta-propeller fold lactonase family protein [Novosphingobium sp. BL-8H]|uniref:YncE family protein n=1 Tax=Novosphingobium sp. BL-8H TaxID=3127640 RepID=UPI0037576D89
MTGFARTMIVANKGENTASFIEMETGKEWSRQATGPSPHEVSVSPNGKLAAIAAYGGSTVDLFDTRTAKRIKTIDISPGKAPHGIAWVSDQVLLLAAEKSRSLVVVNVDKGTVQPVALDQAGSHMVVLSPDYRTAYVSNVAAGTVSVVDLRAMKKLSDIQVGGNPEGLALTRDGKELWVGDNSAPHVRVVDLASGKTVAVLPSDPVPIRVAMSRNGKMAISSNIGAGTISLYSVTQRQLLRTIPVSGATDAIQVTAIFADSDDRVLVAETGRNTVAEVQLDNGKVLRRFEVGKGGDGVAIVP